MVSRCPPQGGPGEPSPLVRLLPRSFSLEANRYVDAAGARNDMHRNNLNACP